MSLFHSAASSVFFFPRFVLYFKYVASPVFPSRCDAPCTGISRFPVSLSLSLSQWHVHIHADVAPMAELPFRPLSPHNNENIVCHLKEVPTKCPEMRTSIQSGGVSRTSRVSLSPSPFAPLEPSILQSAHQESRSSFSNTKPVNKLRNCVFSETRGNALAQQNGTELKDRYTSESIASSSGNNRHVANPFKKPIVDSIDSYFANSTGSRNTDSTESHFTDKKWRSSGFVRKSNSTDSRTKSSVRARSLSGDTGGTLLPNNGCFHLVSISSPKNNKLPPLYEFCGSPNFWAAPPPEVMNTREGMERAHSKASQTDSEAYPSQCFLDSMEIRGYVDPRRRTEPFARDVLPTRKGWKLLKPDHLMRQWLLKEEITRCGDVSVIVENNSPKLIRPAPPIPKRRRRKPKIWEAQLNWRYESPKKVNENDWAGEVTELAVK